MSRNLKDHNENVTAELNNIMKVHVEATDAAINDLENSLKTQIDDFQEKHGVTVTLNSQQPGQQRQGYTIPAAPPTSRSASFQILKGRQQPRQQDYY